MDKIKSTDIPQGSGSRLDADMLGGKHSSTYLNGTGPCHIRPISDPENPTAGAKFFSRVNGGGKVEFCVLFPTGAVQILATEA